MSPEDADVPIRFDTPRRTRSPRSRASPRSRNPLVEIPTEDYDRLLLALHPDSSRAEVEYEKLRQKLSIFFDRSGCSDADIQADEAIGRTARSLRVEVIDNLNAYAYKVAKLQLFEVYRDRERNPVKTGDFEEVLRIHESSVPAPSTSFENPTAKDCAEIRMQCLERCMSDLSDEDQAVLIAWYKEEKRAKKDLRKKLAEDAGLLMPALKTRLFRLRKELKQCCASCIDEEMLDQQRF